MPETALALLYLFLTGEFMTIKIRPPYIRVNPYWGSQIERDNRFFSPC